MIEKTKNESIQILLVEDNKSHAELVIRSLKQHQAANQITHVKDGQMALDYLFQQGCYQDRERNMPHLVLLDLRLPKIDGLEVLKRIKTHKRLNKMPVIVLTTSSADRDVAKAYHYHANSYLVKPLDYEKFITLMDDMGVYWMEWNQDPWAGPDEISTDN